jgi:hypothetical protein
MEEIKFPDLFVDTTLFRDDFELNKPNFQRLLKYKECTNTKIFVSEIVISELAQQYKEKILWWDQSIEILKNQLISKTKEINSYLYVGEKVEINLDNILIETENLIEGYGKYLLNKLIKLWIEIVPQNYSEESFKNITEKVIKWIKPCSRDGKKKDKWFKDALIRESFLALDTENSIIWFISWNHTDYWSTDWSNFHSDLLVEIYGKNLLYFKSINEVRINYLGSLETIINIDYIESNIDKQMVESKMWDIINESLKVDCPIYYDMRFKEYYSSDWGIKFNKVSSVWIKAKTELYTKLWIEFVFEFEAKWTWQFESWQTVEYNYVDDWIGTIDLEFNHSTQKLNAIDNSEQVINASIEASKVFRSFQHEELGRYLDQQIYQSP